MNKKLAGVFVFIDGKHFQFWKCNLSKIVSIIVYELSLEGFFSANFWDFLQTPFVKV